MYYSPSYTIYKREIVRNYPIGPFHTKRQEPAQRDTVQVSHWLFSNTGDGFVAVMVMGPFTIQ